MPAQKMIALSDLNPHPDNPRKISDQQMDGLAASIELGQKFLPGKSTMLTTITVNRKGMRVLGGHQRLKALIKRGVSSIPEADITYISVEPDSDEELAILINLNNPEIAGDWMVDDLDRILGQLKETIGEDYETLALDKLHEKACRSKLEVKPGLTEPDEVPDGAPSPVVEEGELWILGNHRLVCGDCTKPEVLDKVMAGEKADSLVTDPPYGVDYGGKVEYLKKSRAGGNTRKVDHIANDAIKNYRDFFGSFLALIPLKTPNTAYIFMSGQELHNVRMAFEDAKFHYSAFLIWVKDCIVMGRSDYNYQHEFILYGWKGKHKFYGPTNRSTIINCARPKKSELHPTMKPVELVVNLIHDGSPKGGTIIEPFCGSGTTIIAAEQTERICRAIEMSPGFCDVICQRFFDFTGIKPQREDGKKWPHKPNKKK